MQPSDARLNSSLISRKTASRRTEGSALWLREVSSASLLAAASLFAVDPRLLSGCASAARLGVHPFSSCHSAHVASTHNKTPLEKHTHAHTHAHTYIPDQLDRKSKLDVCNRRVARECEGHERLVCAGDKLSHPLQRHTCSISRMVSADMGPENRTAAMPPRG